MFIRFDHFVIHEYNDCMRRWHLSDNDPLNLILAADARLTKTDYTNDHIWEITLGKNDPKAFCVQTTFGLRVHWLRFFPRFISNGNVISDPAFFYRKPVLHTFFPGYFAFQWIPFHLDVEVNAEYWAVESHAIAGRFTIENSGKSDINLIMEWVALLSQLRGSKSSIRVVEMERIHVLSGTIADLSPVCFMTGGAHDCCGSYPALGIDLKLHPHEIIQFTWAVGCLSSEIESFNLARKIATCEWDAEIARIEMQNETQMIEIFTGRDDWDSVFAFSQKAAVDLLLRGNQFLPGYSFVLCRQPENGYSYLKNGSDHPLAWSGQTGLDLYYLASLLLPGGSVYLKDMINNFLYVQKENGFIDWRPGLGGQQSRHLAQPLLATLSWMIASVDEDNEWLRKIFSPLYRFFRLWFEVVYDKDQDGFPEWTHALQTGLSIAPIYDSWNKRSQGVDISTLESPGLAAFLYRECCSLLEIAKTINVNEAIDWLQKQQEVLFQAVNETWNLTSHRYHYRDYETHTIQKGKKLVSFKGSGIIEVNLSLDSPQRLVVHLHSGSDDTRVMKLRLHGVTPDGQVVEELQTRQFLWSNRQARCTTQNIFIRVNKLEIIGITGQDSGDIYTVNHCVEDISLYLPLWAGIPDQKKAQESIQKNLLTRYFNSCGLVVFPAEIHTSDSVELSCTHLVWMQLIGEGLLQYGYRKEVAGLIEKIMPSIINSLIECHAFREYYHAQSGKGYGEMNGLNGLAPIGLFLKAIGVVFLSGNKLILEGGSPFNWPVKICYRGISIVCDKNQKIVTYPDGQQLFVPETGTFEIAFH